MDVYSELKLCDLGEHSVYAFRNLNEERGVGTQQLLPKSIEPLIDLLLCFGTSELDSNVDGDDDGDDDSDDDGGDESDAESVQDESDDEVGQADGSQSEGSKIRYKKEHVGKQSRLRNLLEKESFLDLPKSSDSDPIQGLSMNPWGVRIPKASGPEAEKQKQKLMKAQLERLDLQKEAERSKHERKLRGLKRRAVFRSEKRRRMLKSLRRRRSLRRSSYASSLKVIMHGGEGIDLTIKVA